MTPERFPECNAEIGKGQKDYVPLPAYIYPNDERGETVFCWRLSWRERIKVLITGRVWHHVLTFKNRLQPQLFTTNDPRAKENEMRFIGYRYNAWRRWRLVVCGLLGHGNHVHHYGAGRHGCMRCGDPVPDPGQPAGIIPRLRRFLGKD